MDPITRRPEPNKRHRHRRKRYSPNHGLYEQTVLGEAVEEVIDEEGVEEDGEVERGKVVVEVHDAAHDEGREIVEDPAAEGYFSDEFEVVPFLVCHFGGCRCGG